MHHRALILILTLCAVAAPTSPAGAATFPSDTTAILSGDDTLRAPLPAPTADASSEPQSSSQDGRFLAFVSTSDGLSAEDDDAVENVYVQDRQTGTVTLASRRSGTGEVAHANCEQPAISDDGRRVAFICDGPLDDADTNGKEDVYVRDLGTGTTILVSRASGDGPVGDAASFAPTLNQDGSLVAFTSGADNLAAPGNNGIYLRDLTARTTTFVSRPDGAGATDPDGSASQPSISDDGNRIAFTSSSTNLVTGDTNHADDVFVRTRSTNQTVLVSRADGAAGAIGNGHSREPVISGDGSTVAFASEATNLDPRDTDFSRDIYRRTLDDNRTRLVDIKGAAKADGFTEQPSIDDTGAVITFASEARNLDPAVNDGVSEAVYASRDGVLSLVSRADGAAGPAASFGRTSSVSGDGRKVLFDTTGSLTGEPISGSSSLAVRDLDANMTTSLAIPGVNAGGSSDDPSMSADGRFVAFITSAPALGAPGGGHEEGVVVRNTETGGTVLASRADGMDGAALGGAVFDPSISADGRFVAFTHRPPRGMDQVLVRDLVTGTTTVASRADGAAGAPGNGASFLPVIDAAGDRVAFLSLATNLGDGDTDAQRDLHIRDLAKGTTIVGNRANGANGAKGNDSVEDFDLSADGNHVAFATGANNLGDGDVDQVEDVHERDLAAGTTTLLSISNDNIKDQQGSHGPSVSADGSVVAFSSGNRLTDDGAQGQVYVRDVAAKHNVLASRADGPNGAPAAGEGFDPRLSADGRVVAFVAEDSPNLFPAPVPAGNVLYRRDLVAGTTRLVSRGSGPDGPPSTAPFSALGDITADGACVAFTSRGDLVGPAPGAADEDQVFERTFGPTCVGMPAPAAPPGGGNAPAGGGGSVTTSTASAASEDRTAPVVSGARLSRTRFRVASKATPLVAAVTGTTLTLNVSEPSQLTATVERQRFGARRRGACRVVTRRPRAHRCTAFSRDGVLTRALPGGAARIAFTGRMGRTRLAPGRHRLTLVARDAAGNVSRPVTLRFTVVR